MKNDRLIASSLAVALAMVMGAKVASAAGITWGGAIPVSGASDISTQGTYVNAILIGGGADVTDDNGDVFHLAVAIGASNLVSQTGSATDPITVNLDNHSGFNAGSPGTADAAYNSILSGLGYDNNRGNSQSSTVTLNGLKSGDKYQVEFWASQINGPNANTADLSASGGPILDASDPNPQGSAVPLHGNYALGTFVADGTLSQTFTFTSLGNPVVNAIQLRDISTPEPASLSLLGLGIVGLLARRRRA